VLEHPHYKDTIIIKNPQDASQQVYQRAGDFTDSGTIIDFIRNRMTTVFSTFNRPAEHEFKNITACFMTTCGLIKRGQQESPGYESVSRR
jgi:hypothetical protein